MIRPLPSSPSNEATWARPSISSYTEIEIEQIQASEAAIGDADFASEVSQFSRASIVSQTATAMLAQANVLPANALALL